MNLKRIHTIYFIGIGGAGMSALARYFHTNGKKVAGYDKAPSPVTDDLKQMGIHIHFDDSISNIPENFVNKKTSLIIYTPAIPENHAELNYFVDNNFKVLKRAEILGKITEDTHCLAVAGTHGKTTISSILGHIMQPFGSTAFLGGIAENYNSNLILGEDKISVVEADEFDRSFLQLSPDIACITSVDADHLDVYGEHEALLTSFKEFAAKVSDTLIVAEGLPIDGLTYGLEETADYKAYNLEIKKGTYVFDIKTPEEVVEDVEFHLPGKHNVMNALAALAMADIYGIPLNTIKTRLATFLGVQRRFSYKIKSNNFVLIDDYAHHPTEINAIENSIREMYPDEKITVVFQPHLYTRTKDFADDFAEALSRFDEVILLEIYPARELPIEGITSSWLLNKIKTKNKQLSSKKDAINKIKKSSVKIVAMLGAGDIGLLVNDVKEELINKHKLQ